MPIIPPGDERKSRIRKFDEVLVPIEEPRQEDQAIMMGSNPPPPPPYNPDKSEISIQRLNGKNWPTWKWQLTTVLEAKGLLDVLTGDEPKGSPREVAARQVISCSIDQALVSKVIHCTTAQQIWSCLQGIYENRTSFALTDLIGKMNSYRIKSVENVEDGVSEIQAMAAQIESMGTAVDAATIESAILRALPKSFNSFVTSWTFLDSDKRTLANLHAHIMRTVSVLRSDQSETTKEKALVARHDKNPRKGNYSKKEDHSEGKKPKGDCFYCKKPGHVISECRKLANKKKKESEDHEASGKSNTEKAEHLAATSSSSEETQRKNVALVATSSIDCLEKTNSCLSLQMRQSSSLEIVSSKWIADSGASFHMTSNLGWFSSYLGFENPILVKLGDDRIIKSPGMGKIVTEQGTLDPVYYLPEIGDSLFSISACAKNHKIFSLTTDSDITLFKDGREFLRGYLSASGVYEINFDINVPYYIAAYSSSITEWHEKFNHVSFEKIMLMAKNKAVDGLSITETSFDKCESCALGKSQRATHPLRSTPLSSKPGQCIHVDSVGPMEASLGGAKYFVLAKDEYSSYRFVYFVGSKNEIGDELKKLLNRIKLETGNQVLKLFSDNGSEYKNINLMEFCRANGISQEFSAPYTPEQNGFEEREIRTVVEAARTSRIAAKLPIEFWAESVNAAVYTLNRVVTSKRPEVTPFELWFGRPPLVSNLHRLGELAIIKIKSHTLKFDPKGIKVIFTGYTDRLNTFRFINLLTNELHVTCDAKFLNKLWFEEKNTLLENRDNNSSSDRRFDEICIDTSTFRTESYPTTTIAPISSVSAPEADSSLKNDSICFSDVLDQTPVSSLDPNTVELLNKNQTPESLYEIPADCLKPENPDQERLASLRPRTTKPNYMPWKLNLSTLDSLDDPSTFEEAMNRPDKALWLDAMHDELKSLDKNKVWELVPRPERVNIVTNRWVLRIKRKPDGVIERYRARLVARGFTQVYGQDYRETFAPVVNTTTVRILLSFAAINDLKIAQFDIKTAFLYGDLEEEVYMEQPYGFVQGNDMVCRLRKSLYGLKQAPRQWGIRFRNFLIGMKFDQCKNDDCVFIRHNPLTIIAIYVDDGLVLAYNQQSIDEVLSALKNGFEIHIMALSTFLGFQIERNSKGLLIHQSAYISKLLKKFGMDKASAMPSPITTCFDETDDTDVQHDTPYREAVGSLLYAAVSTRIDIAFAVGKASRAVDKPTNSDWRLVKRIFRYLAGTTDYGLCYSKLNNKGLISYCDSDYGGDVTTSRSTTGTILCYGGAPIHWRSARQAMVTKSSTEAEYVSLCTAITDIVCIRRLAIEVGIVKDKPVPLFCDNESAIRLANNEKCAHRTKHIKIQAAYSREQIEAKEVVVRHLKSELQLADMLTKATTVKHFETNRDKLMMRKSMFTTLLTVLSCLCLLAGGVRFEPLSPLVYQPTDHFIDLGVTQYTYDFTFVNPCDIIQHTYLESKINQANGMVHPANQVSQSLSQIDNPAVIAHLDECNRVFSDTWLVKLKELENIVVPLRNFQEVQSNSIHVMKKRNVFMDVVTGTVISNFICRMVEKILPWSDYNRINKLEEWKRIESERIQKFAHQFNVTHEIQQGMIDLIRNNSINIQEQKRQLAQFATLSSRFTWLSTYIETRFMFDTADLKDIIDKYQHRRIAPRAMSNLLNMTEIRYLDEQDTEMISISMLTPQTIRFKFNVRLLSTDTSIYRVHAFKYWDNLTHTPSLMEYQGTKFVIYNSSANCLKGIEEPTERTIIDECTTPDYKDSSVSIWRTLISTRDIFSQHKTTAFRHTLNWNYIYCFPYNISLKDGIYRCPTTLFRLSSNVGFKTTDRDYHPVIRKVHIVSNNEKAYIEDVHIGHFNDSSIATTGISMFDRIQELLNQLDDKEQKESRSWSVEKYSGSFWFLIGLASVLTTFSLLFMVSNLLLTHHGANKTKRTIRSHVQQVLSEVKDLRQVYDSVSDMELKTALKAVLQSNLTAKSETNNSTSNHNHNTVNQTKPTVEVGGDHTFHINLHRSPVRQLPEIPI